MNSSLYTIKYAGAPGIRVLNLAHLAPYLYSKLSRWELIQVAEGLLFNTDWGLSLACKPLMQGSRRDVARNMEQLYQQPGRLKSKAPDNTSRMRRQWFARGVCGNLAIYGFGHMLAYSDCLSLPFMRLFVLVCLCNFRFRQTEFSMNSVPYY